MKKSRKSLSRSGKRRSRKSTNVTNNLLHNKMVLHLTMVLFVFNVLAFLFFKDMQSLFLLVIVLCITYLFDQNMIIVLLVPMLFVGILIVLRKGFMGNKVMEGMKEGAKPMGIKMRKLTVSGMNKLEVPQSDRNPPPTVKIRKKNGKIYAENFITKEMKELSESDLEKTERKDGFTTREGMPEGDEYSDVESEEEEEGSMNEGSNQEDSNQEDSNQEDSNEEEKKKKEEQKKKDPNEKMQNMVAGFANINNEDTKNDLKKMVDDYDKMGKNFKAVVSESSLDPQSLEAQMKIVDQMNSITPIMKDVTRLIDKVDINGINKLVGSMGNIMGGNN